MLGSLPEEKREGDDIKALITRLEFSSHTEGMADAETLRQKIAADADDNESRYLLANLHIAQGDYETGMDLLLEIMGRDMDFKDGIARQTMLKVFEMLGGSGPLVSRYRNRMYNLLY